MPDVVLECNKIWKKISHHVLVNDLSLTMYAGDIVGFIGPNGAGKTTAIKLMLGLQTLNGGSVKIGGYDLKKEFPKAMREVGAIIENPDLYMYLSGYENLKMAALLYQLPEERVQEVMQLVGLVEKSHEKVKNYSLGMRQRLGIAQAILHKPKLLILDEPMNGLDPEGMKELRTLLETLAKKEKLAILISSHILSELESFCNRICIIAKGVILKDASIEKIQQITTKTNYILELSTVSLDQMLSHYEILDETHIKVTATKEAITNILKTLLLNDVSIFEMKKEVMSLEDIFLKVTKEEKNASLNFN